MTDENIIPLTVDQAVALFKSQDSAHSYNFIGPFRMGFEWTIGGAREKLTQCRDIMIAGQNVRGIGHGIAATESDGALIFFEHDEAALAAFEQEHAA